MANINENYRNIIDLLKNLSKPFCDKNNIVLNIEIPDEFKLNASVRKVEEKKYSIKIYPGCLNLDYRIENITKHYNKDDLEHFKRFKNFVAFDQNENDSYRENLNNLFSTTILFQIFFHEIGHIVAGYVDRTREYIEFDSNETGCYSKQEQEMVADWIGTKQALITMYSFAIYGEVKDNEELIVALKELMELYWITLTIEFQIFDTEHSDIDVDFSKLTHPYPFVRLLYCIEAMREAIMDIFNDFGFNDSEAEKAEQILLKDIYIIVQSFLGLSNCPIDLKKDEKKAYECYILLRELPYSKGYEKNNFLHLEKLDDSYINSIRDLIYDL